MTDPKSKGWLPTWSASKENLELKQGTDEEGDNHEVDQSNDKQDKTTKPQATDKQVATNPPASPKIKSSWLNWRGSSPEGDSNDELAVRNNEEIEEDNDLTPDDNGDEVEEVGEAAKKSSAWAFWNNGSSASANQIESQRETSPEKDKDKTKDAVKVNGHPVNAIVDSTHTFKPEDESPEETDDAVLYKPHDTTRQFNQINTHKNENVVGNVIVPDWDTCLPTRRTNLIPIIQSETTSNANNNISPKMDAKSWRHYLNTLSTRLGFGLHSLTSIVDNKSDSDNQIEEEINLLYEKTYRLYGKSLTKLPHNKRACLPSYNKQFDTVNQIDDDESQDPNSISITDDALGNLLINHKRTQQQQQSRTASPGEIVSQPPHGLHKIKRILIIGVHGFFPTKMIRPIIGSPKGTSLKFANEAEKAIIRYCLENNIINQHETNDMSIQKIALEKEGKIFDRVGFFIEILKQWAKELNDADCIFIAAHSQGCVVTIILLAKLIKLGILKDPHLKRIGMLAMCGINNGPFYGFDKSFFMKAYSTIEHDSLMELFELNKFDLDLSLEYKESIQIIINVNVKICFIGSINDQLVPLYSALASHVFHPNIYRACYIDQSAQTPPFVQKLVSLCCHLQNIGYFDNNVLKELSPILAGPMTGGGHSKIYNDGKVYDLGIKFLLDTDDIVIPPSEGRFTGYSQLQYHDIYGLKNFGSPQDEIEPVHQILKLPIANQVYIKEYNVGKIGSNPFILPWCLRGLMFNIEKNWPNSQKSLSVDSGDEISRTGYDEIDELYDQFDNWKPETKQMKELKFRLNGLRASKL